MKDLFPVGTATTKEKQCAEAVYIGGVRVQCGREVHELGLHIASLNSRYDSASPILTIAVLQWKTEEEEDRQPPGPRGENVVAAGPLGWQRWRQG